MPNKSDTAVPVCAQKSSLVLVSVSMSVLLVIKQQQMLYYIWKVILLLLKEVSLGHPSCLYGFRDNMAVLAVKTEVGPVNRG
jgi:hypothetical protein